MELPEFYRLVGGSYDEVMSRLMTEARVLKYLKKFATMEDMDNLRRALSEEDWEVAFRSSHNLKGGCLNLGLKSLGDPSTALCENLRGGSPVRDCTPMMETVEEKYKEVIELIERL